MTDSDDLVMRLREKAQDCNWAPYNLQSIWKAEEQIEWEAADRISQLEREKAKLVERFMEADDDRIKFGRSMERAIKEYATANTEADTLARVLTSTKAVLWRKGVDTDEIDKALTIAERRVKG